MTPNRSELRRRRRGLSPRQQTRAAAALCHQLHALPQFQKARRLAAYLPNDGEISPRPLLGQAWHLGKNCYLPVLHPLKFNRLYFIPWRPGQALRPNRFGIDEPLLQNRQIAPLFTLDLLLLPLVGFDRSGNRLGMGGGYYDRTLGRLYASQLPRPTLIGLAHHCQEVQNLHAQAWDIPLDMIVSDREVIPTATARNHCQASPR